MLIVICCIVALYFFFYHSPHFLLLALLSMLYETIMTMKCFEIASNYNGEKKECLTTLLRRPFHQLCFAGEQRCFTWPA